MESKTEEKVRYYFDNKSTNPNYYDFSMPINDFEELLKIALKNISSAPFKNNFKLYGINNKFFKIFQDGSCFGYNIKKQEINKFNNFYQFRLTQSQIYNDDFAGLKVYWIEEFYEEIIFKLDDQVNLVFSKANDIPRKNIEYSVFLEPKNASVDITRFKKIIDQIWEEKASSCSI